MKHVFIINSICGRMDLVEELIKDVKANLHEDEYEIHFTRYKGEGQEYAKKVVESGEPVRIYACGGDGTISEIANAICGKEHAQMTVVPLGTGNDLVRYFGGKEHFMNVKNLINGEVMPIDLIKVESDKFNGTSINIINAGFDAQVVVTVDKLRNKPFMNKSTAYTFALIMNLLKYPSENLTVYADDEEMYKGRALLTAIANASHYGGGYNAAPKAKIDDGIMDFLIVKPLKRLKFISLVSAYKNGLILDDVKYEKYIKFRKCSKVRIEKDTNFNLCIDGEIVTTNNITLTMLPKAVKFVKPIINDVN